jgi:hypothetical protein
MALRNPYSEQGRTGDEPSYRREALLRALEDEPEPPPVAPQPLTAQPRTRTPPPTQQTRDTLAGPGGRTTFAPDTDTGNAFMGDRWQDERQADGYTPSPAAGAAPTDSTTAPFRSNRQRGYELMDEYDDPYTRRMEGSPSVGGSAAKYGMAAGSVVPGWGHVFGAAAGAIGALFAKNAETAMTDFRIEDAREVIARAHEDAFGRPITPEYLDQIVRGQGWEDGDRWMGQDSLAYVLDVFAQQAPGERAAQAQANAAAATAATAGATPAGATPGGTGAPGGLPFEGFDFGAQDAGHERANSAKYSYAAAVREAPPLTDTSKGGYEAWVREHIAPRMEADGHRITAFEGDRFKVESPSGSGWVDGLRGAGGDRPGFAWQPDDVGGGMAGGGAISGSSGATSIQDAYAWLKQNADPSWTREEMQAAINVAFADVPGFVEGYAGDAVFDNGKLDLITNFEGPGASWSDNLSLIPLHGGGSPAGASGGGTTTGLNLAPGASLAAPLGNSDVYAQVQAAIQRLMNGTSTRDELLGALG